MGATLHYKSRRYDHRDLQGPSIFWCVAAGLCAGIAASGLPDPYSTYISRAIYVIFVFSVTIATANLFAEILGNYMRKTSIPLPTTGIVFGVLKGSILMIGMLLILSMLGISITPLLTALGVGGLAVALALQDTLSNLFAGLHIIAAGQVRPGDYVKLNTGEEGFVTDITWRNTTIRTRVIGPSLSQVKVIHPSSPRWHKSPRVPSGYQNTVTSNKRGKIARKEQDRICDVLWFADPAEWYRGCLCYRNEESLPIGIRRHHRIPQRRVDEARENRIDKDIERSELKSKV